MDDRHLHFNISTGVWMLAFLLVSVPALKVISRKLPVPGLNELVTTAFGH